MADIDTALDFGDVDPEDAYDDGDTVSELTEVMARTVPSILAERDRDHTFRVEVRRQWAIAALLRLRDRPRAPWAELDALRLQLEGLAP